MKLGPVSGSEKVPAQFEEKLASYYWSQREFSALDGSESLLWPQIFELETSKLSVEDPDFL